jgi:pimeloyl-ACP methyl ester carboxylesterase
LIFRVANDLLLLGIVLGAVAVQPNPSTSADASLPVVPADRLSSPQTLVRVDGTRRLNLLCMGHGSPAVLFDAGTGGGTHSWRFVQAAIARHTTACSYDRAGYGFSDPAATTSDARNAVTDLHNLVVQARLPKPLILVGHSNGGIYAVLYAETYLRDLAGMVLVDPGFTGQQDFGAYGLSAKKAAELQRGNEQWIEFARNCLTLAKSGDLSRSKNTSSPCLDNPPSPDPQLHQALNIIESKPAFNEAQLSEFENTFLMTAGSTVNDREVPINPGALGDLPLIVLTASRHPAAPADFTAQDQAKYYVYWKKGHDRLAALSSNGRNLVVSDSGHFIQTDQPATVVRYVLQLVEHSR